MPQFYRKDGQRYYYDGQRMIPVPEDVSGVARKAAQGATLGLSDELRGVAAGVGAMLPGGRSPGEAYSAARDAERRALQRFGQARPAASLAAEVGGGLATGIGGAARTGILKGAQTLGQLLRRGAAVGAAEGGIAGFGYAQGGPAERAIGTGMGSAFGAATSAAVPAAQAVYRGLRPSAASVLRNQAPMMPESQMRARLAEMGPEATLADVTPGMQTIANATTARLTSAQNLVDRLEERSKGKVGRIVQAVTKDMGGIDQAADTVEELKAIRKQTAGPLYEQALNSAPAPSLRLERLLDDPDIAKIWRRVKTSGARQELMGELGGDAAALTAEEIQRAAPSMRGWHFIQSRLGDEVRRLQRSTEVDATTVRELTQLRNVILGELDQLPNYAQARQIYGSAMGAEEAQKLGEQLLEMPLSKAKAAIGALDTGDLTFARVGLGAKIEDMLTKGLKEGSVGRQVRSEGFEQKLRMLFPDNPAAADDFLSVIDREMDFQETFRRIQGGSDTAIRQAAQEQLAGNNLMRGVRSLVSGNIEGQVAGTANRQLDELAQFALSQDPQVQARALQLMYSPQALPINMPATYAGVGLSSVPGAQLAPQVQVLMGGQQ